MVTVGLDAEIPRWDASPSKPITLKWFLKADTFPTKEGADTAAAAFEEAAKEWNGVQFGVTVSRTEIKLEANFYLIYRTNPPNLPKRFARSFYPHQSDTDVIVYAYILDNPDPGTHPALKSAFVHELGHVFGLRHELAVAIEGRGAVQFSGKNPNSIMAVDDQAATIQSSDKEGIRKFYELEVPAIIDGKPLTVYEPRLRNPNRPSQ
jgi:hypothetical protein